MAATTAGLTVGVAAEIRAWMGRRAIRATQLAQMLGQNNEWVSTRLKGETVISVNDLGRIADALGLKPIDLLPHREREVTLPELRPTPGRSLNRPPNRPAARHRSTGPARTSPIRQLIPA